MHIKKIDIEGFKSYGNKVTVNDFDPGFNAITGLNGSGKSNILDSICFVLGIQNLAQVRATNMNELVYKNGQAGINKATVTITFDNSDARTGPVGYENSREIVVMRQLIVNSGKSKYTINNVACSNIRVQDLFKSIQLNVNNPHFLIMQGRITKVLNMKPMEILSMVEEAVGTRMYEEKKGIALKNLEKKESKLREINTMLDEHICPQLEKLKADKQDYANYTRMKREHEQLSKLYTAWDYARTEELVHESGKETAAMHKKMEDMEKDIKDTKLEIEAAEKRISEIEKQMDSECGSKLQEIESELKAKQVIETKEDTKLQNLKDTLKELKKKLEECLKSYKEEKVSLAQKEKETANSIKKLESLKAASDKDSEAITAAENHFHAVNAGLADTDGQEASVAAQLIAAGKDKKDAETEEKSLEMSMKHLKAELAKKAIENKREDTSYTQDQALYQKLFNEVQKLKNEMSKLSFKEDTFENMLSQERELTREINKYQRELDSITSGRLNFSYADPVPRFDRSKVIGPLALHMQLKDPKESLALDKVARGTLFNIIVEDEITSQLLLDKGQLKTRTTFLPLNKMRSHVIDDRTVQAAEQIVGRGNVALALHRITYDKKLTAAMQYAFGHTLICPTIDQAGEVCFNHLIKKETVSLDGSIFSPQGTLTGGSIQAGDTVLEKLIPCPKLKEALECKQNQLSQLQKDISNMKIVKQRYDSLHEDWELKENEAQLLKSKIEQSTYHKQLQEFKDMQQSYEDHKTQLADCKEKQKSAAKLIKELENKSSKSTRESKVKEAEKAVAECKKKATLSLDKYNNFLAEVEGMKMEIEGIKEGLPEYEKQIAANEKAIEDCETKLREAAEKHNAIKEEVAQLTDELKKQKAILKCHSSDINKIGKQKEAMAKKVADAELQKQQLEHDIKNSGDNSTEASKKLKYLLEKNKWIEGQKKYFGVKNSEFDFEKFKPKETSSMLKRLEDNIEKLEKNVNTRAQNMLSTVEEQYVNLIEKKQLVLKDKKMIEKVIRELDQQKNNALVSACEKVNKDFSSIFTTLLPGTKAQLVAPPGKSVIEGLEFKIAFGDVWKESLNELSGGQRSLVALSLILSLLLFNPAPIYILDEVDAALDLSHTQNIGTMLKNHFTKSQFIIVSLKDGMFNNANVLFRTKFNDGMSSVERHAQDQNRRR
ncbi:hypothetical protein JTE90_010284 [Oedothorax gibbosus]|uniref:Structural maintenance of chromosomes protein n=1 Tax=Oedothorax gibbosus TaxID=931172 RepID=A0AAV6V2N3_9ARAC|nr:hypothetical protein JTE90_010284 [Oedothorax gibbosus]